MITCSGQTAKEVLLKLDFDHKNWESVAKRQSSEIRKSFIQFLLSFFIINHPGVAKEFIEKRSMISSILPGLVKDDPELVQLVLTGFKEKILENSLLSKTAKMKLFSVFNLKHILALFEWKGPGTNENEPTEDFIEAKQTVIDATLEFLITAVTSTKAGLVFHDPYYGTSGSNQNPLLFNLISGLVEPWTRPNLAKVVIAGLGTCPDLIRPYFSKQLQSLWTPRHSEAWFMVIDFVYAIMETLDVSNIIRDLKDKGKTLSLVTGNFCCNDKIFKEVIQECLKVDDHVVKLKGLELQALLLNKMDMVLKNETVSAFSKRQVLVKLQDKLPNLDKVEEVWSNEVGEAVIDIESDKAMDVDEDKNAPNYLLALTQIMSFYWTYYPEKYSSSDMDIEYMLERTQSKKNQNWLVQLYLLRHMISSNIEISTQGQHLKTLITIACKDFNEESGNLALDALFSLLAKFDLCHKKLDFQVWLAFVNLDKIEKVGGLLTEAIINLLEKKENVSEELRQEIGKMGHLSCSQTPVDVESLMVKLLNAETEMPLESSEKSRQTNEFQLSPLLFELLRSTALMHHKNYFEKCVLSSVIVQNDPEIFMKFLKNQDLRSFPSLKNLKLSEISTPECSDTDFGLKLKKMHLLAKIKTYENEKVEELFEILEIKDYSWILSDDKIKELFNPLKKIPVTELLLKVLKKVKQDETLEFYSKRTLELLKKELDNPNGDYEIFQNIVQELPLDISALREILGMVCNSPLKKNELSILQILLAKISQTDQWCMAQFESSVLRSLADILEKLLINPDHKGLCQRILPNFVQLVQINLEFCQMMSKTHLTLAFNLGCQKFVEILVFSQNDKNHASNFKKLMMKNMNGVQNFHKIVSKLLQDTQCKSTFINSLMKQMNELEVINEDIEDLLEILVEKYDQDLSDLQDINPCKALLLYHRKNQNGDNITEKIIIPIMKSVMKLIKDQTSDDILRKKTDLLIETVQTESYNGPFKNAEFESVWPNFVKSCLKYGMRSGYSSIPIEALKVLYEVHYDMDETVAKEAYSLICGHSQFVPIMFSNDSKKTHLLSLITALINADPSICSSVQVPIYLGAYNGTKSQSDDYLFNILYLHEIKGSVSLQTFKPLVWGQAAIAKFSVLNKSNKTQLSKSLKVSEVLALIQPDKMIKSALNMSQHDFDSKKSDELYDPRFFLPLFCQLCAPDSFVDKHLKLVESGALAMAFAGLSDKSQEIQEMSLITLNRIYQQMSKARKSLSAEKQVWLHLVDIVRNGLVTVMKEGSNFPPRIPHLTTAFIVKATKILSNPLDTMFKSVSSFILAKPMMELFEVPEFLRMFHSNDVSNHNLEQEWILSVINDGIKDELDYKILQQNYILKMILTFSESSLGLQSRSLILDIIDKISVLPSSANEMIRHHGLISWLMSKENDLKKVSKIVQNLFNSVKSHLNPQMALELTSITLKLIRNVIEDFKPLLTILSSLTENFDNHQKQLHLKEILPLLYKMASISPCEETDDIVMKLSHCVFTK